MKKLATWMRALLSGVAYLFIAVCLMLLFVGSVQAQEYVEYPIKRNDTVSQIALDHHVGWKFLCEFNHLRNCNFIVAGKTLRIPSEEKAPIAVSAVTPIVVFATPDRKVENVALLDGWQDPQEPYAWTDPSVRFSGRPDLGLAHMGVPDELTKRFASRIERQELDFAVLIDENCTVTRIAREGDWKVKTVLYSEHGTNLIAPVRTCLPSAAQYYQERDEQGMVWSVIVPFNLFGDEKPTKVGKDWIFPGQPLLLVEQTGLPEVPPPPPPPEEEIPQVPPAEQRQVEGLGLWNADLFSNYGHHYGIGGGDSEFVTISGAFRPFWWDTQNRRHMLGIGGRYNTWWGEAADGFKYHGFLAAGGPSYKMYDGRGYDLTVNAPFVGVLNEWGHSEDGKFRMKREFKPVIGFEVFHNRYKRELAKKVWFPELQMYLTVYFPLASDAKQSWEGKRLPNTGDVDKLDVLLSAGVRQFIYDGVFRPYVSANLFAELPLNLTVSPCIGASDHNKILFAEVCYGFGILNSGDSIGWNVGIDWMAALRYSRGQRRTYTFDQQYPVAP